ncbi:MAG: DsbA family protein [Candidatus Micrarchaeota archaeon]
MSESEKVHISEGEFRSSSHESEGHHSGYHAGGHSPTGDQGIHHAGAHPSSADSVLYLLATVILISSVIISASVFFSVSSFSATMGAWSASAGAQAPSNAIAPSPSPTAAPTQAPAAAPRPSAPAKIDLSGLPFQGPADAKVAVVEYADFQCPFCARAYPTVKQVMGDYNGKVRFYFKNFPLSFHQNAQKAAEAYECALEQGKPWEYHDALFTNGQGDGTGLDTASLKQYAAQLGLDTAKFDACLDGGQMASRVAAEQAEGSRNGVSGTPTFFVNGQILVGAQPYSAFKSLIDSQLAG